MARLVKVEGLVLNHADGARPYEGVNGSYQRSEQIANGRSVYFKVGKPSTAMWWTNNEVRG